MKDLFKFQPEHWQVFLLVTKSIFSCVLEISIDLNFLNGILTALTIHFFLASDSTVKEKSFTLIGNPRVDKTIYLLGKNNFE